MSKLRIVISIHVPRVGDDISGLRAIFSNSHFNPRPPCGGRLSGLRAIFSNSHFNPRPPCGGRPFFRAWASSTDDFNPRPQCGGRRSLAKMGKLRIIFQSTSPVWGTTGGGGGVLLNEWISIHVPRVGDDFGCIILAVNQTISIHVPRVGDDLGKLVTCRNIPHFNPRPPCGGRQWCKPQWCVL